MDERGQKAGDECIVAEKCERSGVGWGKRRMDLVWASGDVYHIWECGMTEIEAI